MTNDEFPNDEGMSNAEALIGTNLGNLRATFRSRMCQPAGSSFGLSHSFVLRPSTFVIDLRGWLLAGGELPPAQCRLEIEIPLARRRHA